ncbi:hypothetical protein [Haloechinothrix halophila]|uniref:hypothetical protein n=1 Tax=Haloechinothrix halophila TaxID=1069073 RepID=UPI000408721F|nr:hypothetical protein [Haloechinothrix halophila]
MAEPDSGTRGRARMSMTNLDDIAMLLLAVFSVGLLVHVTFIEPSLSRALWVIIVDTSICGVFLIEFLWRWRSHGWDRWFPLRNFYEILGMIPLAHPALRSLRLLRIIGIVVRLVRAADLVFGERFTYRLVERLAEPIVLAIKKPITVAVLDEVVKVLATGHYPRHLASSLRENHDELQALIAEKLDADPQLGRLKLVPFHDQLVRTVTESTMRVTLEVLTDPRIDEFFADFIQQAEVQIRDAVQRGEHQRLREEQARIER